MPKRFLVETNPYLRDRTAYRKALVANVSSSTAVETGASVESIARMLTDSEATDRITEGKRSAQ